jgi:hypothetical protein
MLPGSKSGLLRRFAALAMTTTPSMSPRSRGTMCPSFANTGSPLLTIEGAGNAGRSMHPQPRVRNKKHTSIVTTVTPELPGIPRAMVLRLIPCSPRRANSCCHRHRRIKADQTRSSLISPPPAWHQQRVSEPHGFAVRSSADHPARRTSLTRFISPCDCHCAPDALASTASRPAVVTTRDRPSGGTRRCESVN